MGDPRGRLPLLVALLVGLVVGYFAGREHLKSEMKTALKDAFEGVSERMKRPLTVPEEEGRTKEPTPIERPRRSPPPAPPVPDPVPVEKSPSKMLVDLVGKEFIPTDLEATPTRYQARIDFDLRFTSNLDKDLRAFTGTVVFNDLFDRTILRVGITVEDALAAGGTVKWSGGIDYNQFMDHHRTLRSKDAKDLKTEFELESVIYADGTRENFKRR